MQCDLCGNNTSKMIAVVEGVELSVCLNCSKFGKVIKQIPQGKVAKIDPTKQNKPQQQIVIQPKIEKIFLIEPDYATIIKQQREKLKMTQEEVAKKISEKESILHNVESGHHEPDINLARKLEKFFRVKLVFEHEEKHDETENKKHSDPLTIADFVKIRKK